MAISVGIMAGVVFQGLNTIGAMAVGFVAVPEPGNDTILVWVPKPMG